MNPNGDAEQVYSWITVMAKNIGTLCKFDQKRLWKLICIVSPFDLFLSQKSNIWLDNKKLKWEGNIIMK